MCVYLTLQFQPFVLFLFTHWEACNHDEWIRFFVWQEIKPLLRINKQITPIRREREVQVLPGDDKLLLIYETFHKHELYVSCRVSKQIAPS